MRLAELSGPFTFEIVEVPIPELATDEVLVQVSSCGVCASELSLWQGHADTQFPARIGHEVSGTVVALGDAVTTFSVSDPVAVWTTGSGYAEYVAIKETYCRLAAGVPLEQALAEPLACATNAVDVSEVRLADDVVIIGAGFMGNLVQQLVALRGARQIIVADMRPDALALAKRCGASRVVDTREESLPDVVMGLTDGLGADITFEVTGTESALMMVGEVTKMSGKIALVGFHQGAPRLVPLAHWNWMAFSLINAHFRDLPTIMNGMTVGMKLLTSGQLLLGELMTHRFSLDDINDAFRTAIDKPDGFVKATITLGM